MKRISVGMEMEWGWGLRFIFGLGVVVFSGVWGRKIGICFIKIFRLKNMRQRRAMKTVKRRKQRGSQGHWEERFLRLQNEVKIYSTMNSPNRHVSARAGK